MSEHLTVSTWNIQGALSDPERATDVFNAITATKADIITLPDAWHEDSEASIPSDRELLVGVEDFKRRGYTALQATFDDPRLTDNYARYGFLTLVHDDIDVRHTETLRLDSRPVHHIEVALGDTSLHIVGLYFSDNSETSRLEQTAYLLQSIEPFNDAPTLIMGDFNAMHGRSSVARFLRTPWLQPLFQRVTVANNVLPHLTRMASGTTMKTLEDAGFIDTETSCLATMPSGLPLFQLDHIMIRDPQRALKPADQPLRVQQPYSDHLQLLNTIKSK